MSETSPDARSGKACWPKPATVQECHEVIDALGQRLTQSLELIDRMGQQLAQLQAQVAALEERLRLNSKNSSKPPSSDGPGSGGNRAQRRSSERRRGAQKGHKGHFRALLDEAEVDEVIDCQVRAVCECGAPVLAEGRVLRHQVFEVPPLKARVEEYRLHGGRCSGCGRRHRAALPPGVPRGQLGPRSLALIGTLATR